FELGPDPHGELRRLNRAVVARAAAIALELDLPRERTRDDERRLLGVDSAELQAGGEHEHVGREAVPTLMRRDPDLLLSEPVGERSEDRPPAERAAPIPAPLA